MLLLFVCYYANAQQFSAYQSITTNNGLPSNYVFAICEDSEGFMWAGTDKGLCRYNGFSWQVWDRDNGLPGNYINGLLPDKRNGLWLHISDKGLLHFDIRTGKVRLLALPGALISKVLETDKHGNLFVTVAKGIEILGIVIEPSAKLKQKTIFRLRLQLNTLIKANTTDETVYALSTTASDMPAVKSYTGDYKLKEIKVKNGPGFSAIYYASKDAIVTNNGIFFLKKDKMEEKYIPLFDGGNTYAFTLKVSNGYFITDIKTGYYFVDTIGNTSFVNNTNGTGSDYINQVYQANDNTIIFATLGGGLRLVKNNYKQTASTDNKIIHSIVKSKSNWLALAGNEILQFNQASTTLKSIATVDPSSLNIYVRNNDLIVGSLKGVHLYTLNKNSIASKNFIALNAGISSVIATKENEYIGGSFGTGLITFNANSILNTDFNSPIRIIEKLVPLSYGFATLSHEDGIILLDTVTYSSIHLKQTTGLLSNSVFHVHEYNDTLYIGSKHGLNVFANGKVVAKFSFDQGFTGTKAIYAFHDHLKRLWIVSDQYLHLLQKNRLQAISSYPLLTGKDDLLTTALYDSASHTLATGSLSNISLVAIDNIYPDTTRSLPRLLHTFVDGKERADNEVISYSYKDLRFAFAPIASSPLATEKIYYRLSGNNWKELHDSLIISFLNLRPGNYQLEAKILNADGFESPVIKLTSFTVLKPFWQSLWFTLLAVLLTIISTLTLFRKIENIKRKKIEAKLYLQQSLQLERERISKDLHDHLGTNLVTMIAQVDSIETKLHHNALAEATITASHLSTHARQVMSVLRETIWAVQENEHDLQSFIIRIRTFLQRLYESTGISWQVTSTADNAIMLTPQQTLHLFRIIQEASQNILKHAKATEALYMFEQEDHLKITITDNGVGLSTISVDPSNGFSNMKQRINELNGTISFTSEKKGGTAIMVTLPI